MAPAWLGSSLLGPDAKVDDASDDRIAATALGAQCLVGRPLQRRMVQWTDDEIP
jgi:hypothetical protein